MILARNASRYNIEVFILHRIRRNARILARIHLALFALVWLSLAVVPCALAMELGNAQAHDHVCPHCPPRPCHEVQPDECQAPDSLDSPRMAEHSVQSLAPPAEAVRVKINSQREQSQQRFSDTPPARAGPRAHLLHLQFNE